MSTVLTEPAYHLERIDGREIQKPLPKKLHFLIERYLVIVLSRDLSRRYVAGPELNVLCGEDRLVPDVSVVERNARYENGDLADPPQIAVEILSPGQTVGQLFDKADRLVRAGAPVSWVIWPERRQAWMYSAHEMIEAKESLAASLSDGSRVEVNLAEMWAELD
jgi:Uma2 family endonuclease